MTEITPERSALLLADASRILRRKLATWPATLQPGELAAFLAGTSKGEQFKEWRYRIMRAIEAGHLSASSEQFTARRLERIRPYPAASFMGAQIPAGRVAEYSERESVRHHIGTTHAASWFRAAGLPFSDTVRAWLGPAWQEEAQKVDAGDTAPAENAKRQKLRAMLERIKELDPGDMPGQKIDFHALARAYDKDFQVSPATFSDYLDKPASLPKLCTFGQGAERDPDYYRSICDQIGVTVTNYDRALKDLEMQKASAKAKKGDGGKK